MLSMHRALRAQRTRRLDEGDDAGFTVVELTVVVMIMMLVLTAFYGLLDTLTKHEHRTQALVGNEQAVRFFINELAREIRSSNPMQTQATTDANTYTNSIELALGSSDSAQQYVRWTYDEATQTISREILTGPGGTATIQTAKLDRVRNNETGAPFLKYYNQHAQDLVALGNADDVANCAIRVTITVTSDSNPGPTPFTEIVDAELRNRLPGGVGCG
jgi:type II secretory pathway pseudopilin PulG